MRRISLIAVGLAALLSVSCKTTTGAVESALSEDGTEAGAVDANGLPTIAGMPDLASFVPNPSKMPLSDVEAAVIYRTNKERASRRLPLLTVDPSLMANARNFAAMNARDRAYNRHSGQNVAENVFYQVRTSAEAVGGWMNSAAHRANILNGQYKRIGVGVAVDATGVPHWVQQMVW